MGRSEIQGIWNQKILKKIKDKISKGQRYNTSNKEGPQDKSVFLSLIYNFNIGSYGKVLC